MIRRRRLHALSEGTAAALPTPVRIFERGTVLHDEEHGGVVVFARGIVGRHALVVKLGDVGVLERVHESFFSQDALVA